MSEIKMEIKDATKEVCSILDKLQQGMLQDLNDPRNMNHEEAGAITDMIKDVAEAKEKLVKAIYYEHLLEAMEKAEYGEDYDEDGPIERMGYRGRSSGSGRYIARGYTRPNEYPIVYDPVDNYRMGYRDGQMSSGAMNYNMNGYTGNNGMSSGSGGTNSNQNGNNAMRNYEASRHGVAFDNYKNARRNYTVQPNDENRMKMNASWEEAVDDAIQALKKMYMEAEPVNRRKVNEKVSRALQEMPL